MLNYSSNEMTSAPVNLELLAERLHQVGKIFFDVEQSPVEAEAGCGMSILVQSIRAQIVCKDGVKDSSREVAQWVTGQLKTKFGDIVEVRCFDLFDADCPSMPAGAQLPLALVRAKWSAAAGRFPCLLLGVKSKPR